MNQNRQWGFDGPNSQVVGRKSLPQPIGMSAVRIDGVIYPVTVYPPGPEPESHEWTNMRNPRRKDHGHE